MATSYVSWPEIRKIRAKADSGSLAVDQLVAVHAVAVDDAGVRDDVTVCHKAVLGDGESGPFTEALTASRCDICDGVLSESTDDG